MHCALDVVRVLAELILGLFKLLKQLVVEDKVESLRLWKLAELEQRASNQVRQLAVSLYLVLSFVDAFAFANRVDDVVRDHGRTEAVERRMVGGCAA